MASDHQYITYEVKNASSKCLEAQQIYTGLNIGEVDVAKFAEIPSKGVNE